VGSKYKGKEKIVLIRTLPRQKKTLLHLTI
jgi:hypothetical protein